MIRQMTHFFCKFVMRGNRQLKKHSRISNFQCNLIELKVLPSNKHVYLRFKTLQHQNKGIANGEIAKMLAEELIQSWKKQDIPSQHKSNVIRKLKKMLKNNKGKFYFVLS